MNRLQGNRLTNAEKILIALMGIVLILWGFDQLRTKPSQMTFEAFYAKQALRYQKSEKHAYIGS